MPTLQALIVAVVLLLLALGIAASYLAMPVALVRRTGALRAARWFGRLVASVLSFFWRAAIRHRPRRIRRLPSAGVYRVSRTRPPHDPF